MKKSLSFFLLLLGFSPLFSQKISFETLLEDNISIRAIDIWNGKVWYAGSQSKFGYVNIEDRFDRKQIKLDSLNREFRVIARIKHIFQTANVGSPADFYGISPSLRAAFLYQKKGKNVFFDSFVVNEKNNKGMAISDPEENGSPTFFFTVKGKKWKAKDKNLPKYFPGEAHFAASNSNIAMYGNEVWIGTGGSHARIFKFNWKKPYNWEVFETPFIQGTSSQGIYSLDFYDENFGIAVGGDYTKQEENINNIATTNDGGKTWQIQASGKNSGYSTCVKFRPASKGKDILIVGDRHISFSTDYGKTWKKLSDEKGFYTCKWFDENTVILAGKNRIVKMHISFE